MQSLSDKKGVVDYYNPATNSTLLLLEFHNHTALPSKPYQITKGLHSRRLLITRATTARVRWHDLHIIRVFGFGGVWEVVVVPASSSGGVVDVHAAGLPGHARALLRGAAGGAATSQVVVCNVQYQCK